MPDPLEQGPFPWELGVYDAHCHPTDTLATLCEIPGMKAKVLTVMATRAQDQDLVAKAAEDIGFTGEDSSNLPIDSHAKHKVLPAFGWHPWFSHQMFDETEHNGSTRLTAEQKIVHYQSVLSPKSEDLEFLRSLPDPRPFGHFIGQTRDYLLRFPLALIGEVGLDKSFRIPENWLPDDGCQCGDQRENGLTPGGREGRKLSPYRVSMDHQRKVLLAQLALAGELHRAVSIHGVQAHGVLHDTLAQTWKGYERKKASKRDRRKADGTTDDSENQEKVSLSKPYPPRICLHSFSGPAETVKQYIASAVPCEVFFSFSTTINAWAERGDGKVEAAVKMVPDDRILVESDLHTAGDRMDDYLEEGVRKICNVKGWVLEEGVKRLARNWRHFALGMQ